jgi:hypothetical protein
MQSWAGTVNRRAVRSSAYNSGASNLFQTVKAAGSSLTIRDAPGEGRLQRGANSPLE